MSPAPGSPSGPARTRPSTAEPRPGGAVLRGLTLALVAWIASSCGSGRELTIIVISLDTTRPDHLTPYGYDRATTPTLARLADEGVVFDNARSTTSWTLPAHMSLFTGQPAAVHGVEMDFHQLDPSRRTMGEYFADADFRTMGFFSAPYLHGHFGFDRGMDYYERCVDPTIFDIPPSLRSKEVGTREVLSHQSISSNRIMRRFLNTLDQRRRPRTLGFLHFFDPHYDWLAPPRYVKRFADPRYAGIVEGREVTYQDWVLGDGLPDADLQHAKDLYDAELAWVDENLATLVAYIEEQGLSDSTLIVITGDHGEEFFEHGRFGHRVGLHDEVLRVPLLMWGPGLLPEGLRIDDDVALYDILPTVLDYADIEAGEHVYGRSLRPLIEGAALPPRPVSSSLTMIPHPPVGYYEAHDAVVYQGLKAIRTVKRSWSPDDQTNLDGDMLDGSLVIHVYDLEQDPAETTDLFPTQDARVPAIVEQLDVAQRSQREAADRMSPVGDGIADDLGLSMAEVMKAVGYLQGEDVSSSEPPDGR